MKTNHNKNATFRLTAAALTAAAYALFTVALAPISYGAIQLRVSELLCILPFYFPCTVWGLFLGCFLANLFTGNVFDILFGSLATLLAALGTRYCGKRGNTAANRLAACLIPVAVNAAVIGAVITCGYNGLDIFEHPGVFALNAAQTALGEGAVLLLGGLPLLNHLPSMSVFKKLNDKIQRS